MFKAKSFNEQFKDDYRIFSPSHRTLPLAFIEHFKPYMYFIKAFVEVSKRHATMTKLI